MDRVSGVRLRGTPLPAWTYLGGRSGSALVTSLVSVAIIITTAVVLFHVTIIWEAMGYFAAAAVLGMMCRFLLGVAVTIAVPKTDAALPVAYGTVLPRRSSPTCPSPQSTHRTGATTSPPPPRSRRWPARWKQRSSPPPIHGRCQPPGCWQCSAGATSQLQ